MKLWGLGCFWGLLLFAASLDQASLYYKLLSFGWSPQLWFGDVLIWTAALVGLITCLKWPESSPIKDGRRLLAATGVFFLLTWLSWAYGKDGEGLRNFGESLLGSFADAAVSTLVSSVLFVIGFWCLDLLLNWMGWHKPKELAVSRE